MTAARLEELAGKCDAACESQDFGLAEFLDTADIADLARCARVWAKVELALDQTRDVTLQGIDDDTGLRWTWWPDNDTPTRARTAIEAVEAAEVGK